MTITVGEKITLGTLRHIPYAPEFDDLVSSVTRI